MTLYTRTGDAGLSGIKDQRLDKGALVFDVLGDLDELSSRVGTVPTLPLGTEIQRALCALGADIAGYGAFKTDLVPALERAIDTLSSTGGAGAFSFVLPRSPVHVTRCVCRRLERSLQRLCPGHAALPFLNRLSDYLFACAEWGPGCGRSVLVTGGARRIGRAICEVLAAHGWRVVVHARRADDAEAIALAERLGGVFASADLLAADAPQRLFERACALAPDLSAVVNNAAIFRVSPDLPASERAALQRVNVDVPQELTRMLADRLGAVSDRGRGAVVDLLDARVMRAEAVWGQQACDNKNGRLDVCETPYAASKRALKEHVARAARSFAPVLRVNGVAPGPVLPPADANQRERGGETLLGTRPTPRDVAEAVAYLLDATTVTGNILPVDAGQALRPV